MLIRTHIGVSLDGFVSTPDGMPVLDVMPDFVAGESYGMREFEQQIDAVVVGRTTFESGYAYWSEQSVWAWEGKRVYVLTSQQLPAKLPPDVIASQGGAAGLLEQLRTAGLAGDVHLLGGPQTLKAFHQLGAIDRFEVVVLPIMLGEGMSLFPLSATRQPLRLERQQSFPDGAVELVYSPA